MPFTPGAVSSIREWFGDYIPLGGTTKLDKFYPQWCKNVGNDLSYSPEAYVLEQRPLFFCMEACLFLMEENAF